MASKSKSKQILINKLAGKTFKAKDKYSLHISVIMPCLNEELTIGACIKKSFQVLHNLGVSHEILVSDNGSTDKSQIIAINNGARVILTEKRGYGSAYMNGFKHAKGKYIIMFDSDTTYDPLDIPRFIKKIEFSKSDLVIGTRLHGKIEKGAMPWLHKYIGNPFLTTVLNLLFGTNISDSHCGMRALSKEAYQRFNMESDGMEFASEMIVKAALLKLKITEIPINYYRRPEGSFSKLNSLSDGFRHLKFLLSTWAKTR